MTKSAARRLPTPPTIASDKVCGSPSSPFKVFTKSTARRLTISPIDKDGSDLEGDSDSEDSTYEVEGSGSGSDDDETEEDVLQTRRGMIRAYEPSQSWLGYKTS
ncbi:hypothetical protein R6Q59_013551 [Mikania micrantha]